MARVDYYGLLETMRELLDGDPSLGGVHFAIEEEMPAGPDEVPWVGISITGREAPGDIQRIAAGQRTRFVVTFSLWCWAYDIESKAAAIRNRDDLLGRVEIALMRPDVRTLRDQVDFGYIEGGSLTTGTPEQGVGFFSGGEIVFKAEVDATT